MFIYSLYKYINFNNRYILLRVYKCFINMFSKINLYKYFMYYIYVYIDPYLNLVCVYVYIYKHRKACPCVCVYIHEQIK